MPATRSCSPAATREDRPHFLLITVQTEEDHFDFGDLREDSGGLLLQEQLLDIVIQQRIAVAVLNTQMNLLSYRVNNKSNTCTAIEVYLFIICF